MRADFSYKNDYFFKKDNYHTRYMIPARNGELLYSTHLKGDEELYIKRDSLVVIHKKKGNTRTLDLSILRCVLPISHDSFKVFWRAPRNNKNKHWNQFERYNLEFELDLKKSYPDKKQRRMAEKTESKKISNIILHAIQNTHLINQPNMKANLAMHTGEYVRGVYEGQCKIGKGNMVITNLGVYFVSFDKGLYLDLPLDLLDSYDYKNKTVRIHYFEPRWIDGYDTSSKKNRKMEIRIKDESASIVCDKITSAYSDGGAKEIREFQKLTDEFGSMTPDELHAAYYAGKYTLDTEKPIDRYFRILAKRKWGIPSNIANAWQDAHVVAACLTTGIPLESAGDLELGDVQIREYVVEYVKEYHKYCKQYDQLQDDLDAIIHKNLDEDDVESLKACHPRVIDDTIQHIAKTGHIPDDSFEPESSVHWKNWVKEFNQDIINQNIPEYPNGFYFNWKHDIVCVWDVEDAKRIVKDKDYKSIVEAIKLLDENYVKTFCKIRETIFNADSHPLVATPPMHPAIYSRAFQNLQARGTLERTGRVYVQWCKSHPLSEFTDPNDKKWLQYMYDNLDETKTERIKDYYGCNETPAEHLRRCEAESQNRKIRLERTVKPKDIPDEDIYADAWFDRVKHRWFTTNQYSRITEPELEIMTTNECENKYGFKASVFSEDSVQLRHGMPAIYDEDKKWWILLCTVSEYKITKEMVHDKGFTDTLRYDAVESVSCLSGSGQIGYGTVREQIFYRELYRELHPKTHDLLPFNERLRRLLFRSITSIDIPYIDKEKMPKEIIAA